MRRVLPVIAIITFFPALVQADAEITLRDGSKVKGTITDESTLGVTMLGKKDIIPTASILDIIHDVKPTATQINMNRPAFQAERDFLDPAKEAARGKNLKEALAKYRETLKNLEPGQKFPERHIQYKIAFLTTVAAREGQSKIEYGLLDLRDFKDKHPNSWQLTECLKTLAEIQIGMKSYADAEKTYKELALANVDVPTKQEAEFLAAQVSIRAGKPGDAQKNLQTLLGKLPKGSSMIGRTQIAITETMLATKQTEQGRQMLAEIIKGTQDSALKARAYNTLGKSYFDAGQMKEARWEFLWVDLMYNENRDEHARALYHLWQIFTTLGEAERAIDCRDTLLNNRAFLGTEYQRLAKEKAG